MSKFSLLTVPSDLPSIWLRRGLNGHQSPADFKGRRSRVNPIYVCSRSRPHNTKSRLCLPGIRWRNNWWHRTKCTLTHSAGLIYCMLVFCTTKRALHFLIMKVLFLLLGARHSGIKCSSNSSHRIRSALKWSPDQTLPLEQAMEKRHTWNWFVMHTFF